MFLNILYFKKIDFLSIKINNLKKKSCVKKLSKKLIIGYVTNHGSKLIFIRPML